MTDPLYRELILDHWEHPQNYGVLDHPDIDITQSNPLCGDEIRIMANIKNKKIDKISFTCSGCALSKASASLLTLMVQDLPVKKYCDMKPEEFLGTFEIGLSPVRVKCALLCFSALKKALRSK